MIATFSSRTKSSPLVTALALIGLASAALTQPRLESAEVDPSAPADGSIPAPPVAPAAPRPPELPVAPSFPDRRVAQAPTPPKPDSVPASAPREASRPAPDQGKGVPMEVLIEQVAKNIQKRVIVDPRAKGLVTLYGQKISEIDYPQLLTILGVHGYTAFELNGYVKVVPISDARSLPMPTVIEGQTYPDDQFVNARIALKNSCAMQLIPILRPMLPGYAHLAADAGSNSMLIVDTFANFKRMESTIKELDAHSPSQGQCGQRTASSSAEPAAQKN